MTETKHQSEVRTIDYTGVWSQYGIDPRQLLGVDPRTLPGPQVIQGGALMVKKFKGGKASLWLYKNSRGQLAVTIRYVKTGRKLRVDLAAVDQPGWRTLNETLQAACDHGYLRLRRDRKEELEKRAAEEAAVKAQEMAMAVDAQENSATQSAA